MKSVAVVLLWLVTVSTAIAAPVAFAWEGDAEAEIVAVAPAGNAHATGAPPDCAIILCPVTGDGVAVGGKDATANTAAVSVNGDAHAPDDGACRGVLIQMCGGARVAVASGGDAHGGVLAVAPFGSAAADMVTVGGSGLAPIGLAVSGSGDETDPSPRPPDGEYGASPYLKVSASNDLTDPIVGISVFGGSRALIVGVSGRDDATGVVAVAGEDSEGDVAIAAGDATGSIAVSGLARAEGALIEIAVFGTTSDRAQLVSLTLASKEAYNVSPDGDAKGRNIALAPQGRAEDAFLAVGGRAHDGGIAVGVQDADARLLGVSVFGDGNAASAVLGLPVGIGASIVGNSTAGLIAVSGTGTSDGSLASASVLGETEGGIVRFCGGATNNLVAESGTDVVRSETFRRADSLPRPSVDPSSPSVPSPPDPLRVVYAASGILFADDLALELLSTRSGCQLATVPS